MRRLYSNVNNKYRSVSTQTARSIAALERESAALRSYIAEREASEARAESRAAEEAESRREEMLEVAKDNPVVVKMPDKRRTAFTKGGKKVKTRTRRTMGRLRLNRAKRGRKVK